LSAARLSSGRSRCQCKRPQRWVVRLAWTRGATEVVALAIPLELHVFERI
jgi:hypothetical protein